MDFYNAAGYPHWLSSLLIPAFGAGAYGVDLFFALSAYLITSLLLRERAATGALDLRGFYLRRILRIWPLYLAFVAFAAIFAALVPGQHLPMKYVVGYSLLAGNWIYVFYGLPASFATPLWTVSIEEQFYLAWPLALRKASVRTMAIIAVGILVVANAWRVWLAVSAAPVERIEYNTFTRLDPIAFGILIALFGHKLPSFTRLQRAALLCGGVVTWIAVYAFTVTSPTLKFTTWQMAVGHPLRRWPARLCCCLCWGRNMPSCATRLCCIWERFLTAFTCCMSSRISARFAWCMLQRRSWLWRSRSSDWRLPSCWLRLRIAGWKAHFLRLKERFAHVQSRPV